MKAQSQASSTAVLVTSLQNEEYSICHPDGPWIIVLCPWDLCGRTYANSNTVIVHAAKTLSLSSVMYINNQDFRFDMNIF